MQVAKSGVINKKTASEKSQKFQKDLKTFKQFEVDK